MIKVIHITEVECLDTVKFILDNTEYNSLIAITWCNNLRAFGYNVSFENGKLRIMKPC